MFNAKFIENYLKSVTMYNVFVIENKKCVLFITIIPLTNVMEIVESGQYQGSPNNPHINNQKTIWKSKNGTMTRQARIL